MTSKDDRDDHRPKRSWREIDAQRDRSRGPAPRDQQRRQPLEQDRASKQHRAALEALFAKGGMGKIAEVMASAGRARTPGQATEPPQATTQSEPPPPASPSTTNPSESPRAESAPAQPAIPAEVAARQTARKKVIEAVGRSEITRAVDRYLEQFGMPSDFEMLEQALEHQRDECVLDVLQALAGLLDRERPKRSRALAGKLRFLEETGAEGEVRELAARVRAKLA